MSGHWLSFQIRQTTPKFEQNSETSETNTESLLSKFYLCTVPRHHRHQPATHCPKNRFQLLTKLHKERNKIAAEAAEATTHTQKKTTITTTTTTTKEEGRKLRRKDEGQRTNVEGRGRTHIPGDQLCMFTVFGLPAIVLGGLDNWLLKKSMYVYLYRCNIIEYIIIYYVII